MSGRRKFYLDKGIGEERAVVTLDGLPERLILSRSGDDARLKLGARLVARVRRVEPAFGAAFLDLGAGGEGLLTLRPDARPVEGQSLAVEVRSEPRRGKLAVLRETGPAEGAPRLLEAAPPLVDQLRAMARGEPVLEGREARQAADEAEAEVLGICYALPSGGDIAIETTRALTSVDVDLGARKGTDGKRVTRQANLAAVGAAARLLRLKGLGGLVVIDLVGRGHDGAALLAAARAAFAPDNPGVAIGPVSKFGTMEISIPRRTASVRDILCGADGAVSDRTLALRLMRVLQGEAQMQPGAQFTCTCAPPVASATAALADELADQIGRRFAIAQDPTFARERFELGVR